MDRKGSAKLSLSIENRKWKKEEEIYAAIFFIIDCVEDLVFTARNGYKQMQYAT